MRTNSLLAEDESAIAADVARLVAMLEAVKAATPMPKVIPLARCSLLSFPDPSMRRAFALAQSDRLQKINGLAQFLSDSADVPLWLARMAMNAAVPVDRETDLDDDANHFQALRNAAAALGLDPLIIETQPSSLAS